MKKRTIAVGLAVLIAAGGFFMIRGSKSTGANMAEMSYQTSQILKQEIEERISTSGVINSKEEETVESKIQGKIEEVLVKEGDVIKEGDIVARIDKGDLDYQIENATLQLKRDRDTLNDLKKRSNSSLIRAYENAKNHYDDVKEKYEKNEVLYKEGAVSKVEIDNLKAEMDRAKNTYLDADQSLKDFDVKGDISLQVDVIKVSERKLEDLKKQLEDTNIKSNVSGTVTKLHVDKGDYVNLGGKIVDIHNLNDLEVIAGISEYDIHNVKKGQEVTITTLGMKDKKYTGKVTSIGSVGIVNGKEVSVEVKIDIEDEDQNLKPNFSSNIEIITKKNEQALVIPYEALERVGKNEYVVNIKRGEEVVKVPVKTGIHGDLVVEVVSEELKENDEVVTNYDQVISTVGGKFRD